MVRDFCVPGIVQGCPPCHLMLEKEARVLCLVFCSFEQQGGGSLPAPLS